MLYGSFNLGGTPPCGSPTPPVAPLVYPETFGALGNGVTDDQAALQAAFNSITSGTVVLTPGKVYNHSGVLTVNNSVVLNGGGYRCNDLVVNAGTLASTVETTSAVQFYGQSSAYGVIFTSNATARGVTNNEMKVAVFGTNQVFHECMVDGSRAAGIYVQGASNYLINRCIVKNTKADGFHNCCGANTATINDPYAENVGDDGVAVVSYDAPGLCHHITINNPVIRGSLARGCSIVGGEYITFNNIDVEDTRAAGLYLASEPSYTTWKVDNCLVNGGVIRRANYDSSMHHGSILFYADYDVITNTTVQDIDVYDTAGAAPWHMAAYWGGANPIFLTNICVYAPARTFLTWDQTGGGLTQTNVNYC